MQDKILSGTVLAAQILNDAKISVDKIKSHGLRVPTLAVILVGHDPASQIYVANKKQACQAVGIQSLEYLLPDSTTQIELNKLIKNLNDDNTIDGILVQLPLPKHLEAKLVIETIATNKDVDGFKRSNMGALAINDPLICPCTPHGIMYMLDSIQTEFAGKHAVVIGTSNIVGRPMMLELINRGATVTICNSKTLNLPSITKLADILIVAVGRAHMVTADWIKEDSIIIDVGMNRDSNGRLCGDVNFTDVVSKVKYITPVPGGVGKMTIAMLIKNTLRCYSIVNTEEK